MTTDKLLEHSKSQPPHQKCEDEEITSVGEDVEKREPSCTVDGNVNWCSHCGKQYGDSSKN